MKVKHTVFALLIVAALALSACGQAATPAAVPAQEGAVAEAMTDDAMMEDKPAAMVIDIAFVSLPMSLEALTVKWPIPAFVGIPLILPLPSNDSPAGRLPPLSKDHVAAALPSAASVWL